MERSDSILLRAITQGTQHQYAALHPDEEETVHRIREERPREDGTSAHNTPSDRDPSRVTAMGSEASLEPASENIAENATNEERPKPGKIPSTEHRSGYILLWYWSILAWPFPLGSSPVPCPSVLSPQ